ncbi:MAG: AI-2E family transporter [Chloroflexi bacterium]|nr:AI-2E family transporter [Chloroflexota bacterium]
MERNQLINIVLVLIIILITLIVAQMVWHLLSDYADVLLLFLLGWLVSFILNPIVSWLGENSSFRLPRAASIAIIYLAFALIIVIGIALLAPIAIQQLSDIARRLPALASQAPPAMAWLEDRLARIGAPIKIDEALRAAVNSLQGYVTAIVQNALGIFTSLLGFVANFLFVLILGFYFTLDGPRLRAVIRDVIPSEYKDEASFFARSVDRTFGGFMRGQLIQSIAISIGTLLVMTILGLNFSLVISLFAGLFMLIPLVGPFLALLPPLFVALIQAPNLTIWVLVALFIYQFVITNVIMPRLLSDSLDMHPLLVLAAIFLSVKVAGFWGAFFGIPIVGVLWAMFRFFFERWQSAQKDSRPLAK